MGFNLQLSEGLNVQNYAFKSLKFAQHMTPNLPRDFDLFMVIVVRDAAYYHGCHEGVPHVLANEY